MTVVRSTGELTLESMPDAPSAEWLRAFLQDYNSTKRQLVAALGALTLTDNTQNKDKTINLVHGVRTEIASPLDATLTIKTVAALQVDGVTLDGTGKPNGSIYALGLVSPIAWQKSTNAGRVYVTAKYDISPSAGVTGRVKLLFVGE